jgi:hypothetical protein
MKDYFPLCRQEKRQLDGFDMISVLGFMKEYNLQEIWRNYLAKDRDKQRISMYVEAENYFLELHFQRMDRIILSEKFNTNPFFLQQVVQRLIASHPHHLILSKIKNQGIDTGDNPISLSCSLGNTIIDLIVNKNEPFRYNEKSWNGDTPVEREEQRPLDIYDISSILYLCQRDLTESVFQRYGDQGDAIPGNEKPGVHLSTGIGKYDLKLQFHYVSTRETKTIRPPGNASINTMHSVVQRMNFCHSETLILKELKAVGLSVTSDQVAKKFSLSRLINNTSLILDFEKHR